MADYIPVIGMEVHVELKTKSKMFCSCKNDPDEPEPNKNICEICTAQPGTLPVPNREAIAWTVKIGKALGCTIRELSKFDRKHYFYPDLPKGYQISQYDEPIAEGGNITLGFALEDNIRDEAAIGITRVHLEEDTAKLSHDKKGATTLVDFNRAGTPLVEIVTNPDFKTAAEAKKYSQELRLIFRALGVSDADMEKGHMRCEANVSVQEAGRFEIVGAVVKPLSDYTLNNKVELKNLNSFRAVERAVLFEIERQKTLLEKGESWPQQTRGWDEDRGETVLQRTKENAQDYRYFPDPDIPPFHPRVIAGEIHIPELPQKTRTRLHEEYGFSYADAQILSEGTAWTEFAEAVMSELYEWLENLPDIKTGETEARDAHRGKIARAAGGWLTSKLAGELSARGAKIQDIQISAENFAELIALTYAGRVNSTNAQKILAEMIDAGTDADPTHIMEEKGYGQISDEKTLDAVIERVIASHSKQVEEYIAGKEPVLKFLVGMVMKATEGAADPQAAERLMQEKLKKNG